MVMLISMNCNDKSDFASGDYLFVFKAIKRELTLPNSLKGREYLKLILMTLIGWIAASYVQGSS